MHRPCWGALGSRGPEHRPAFERGPRDGAQAPGFEIRAQQKTVSPESQTSTSFVGQVLDHSPLDNLSVDVLPGRRRFRRLGPPCMASGSCLKLPSLSLTKRGVFNRACEQQREIREVSKERSGGTAGLSARGLPRACPTTARRASTAVPWTAMPGSRAGLSLALRRLSCCCRRKQRMTLRRTAAGYARPFS